MDGFFFPKSKGASWGELRKILDDIKPLVAKVEPPAPQLEEDTVIVVGDDGSLEMRTVMRALEQTGRTLIAIEDRGTFHHERMLRAMRIGGWMTPGPKEPQPVLLNGQAYADLERDWAARERFRGVSADWLVIDDPHTMFTTAAFRPTLRIFRPHVSRWRTILAMVAVLRGPIPYTTRTEDPDDDDDRSGCRTRSSRRAREAGEGAARRESAHHAFLRGRQHAQPRRAP